ncbi:ABC-type Fe3+-siderophore transport system, permease component [Halobacteroides halobius DSM 5150]|uniref:ABC-type Fe3+-siderophore transport system, permease component n=1 Tax=Halobacteroides halobius (strain ATCC 35273 / DSM 5150 / MD-1) TaxID=748449 RepID=L0K6C9_HALHC|nr:iron ABC transporter permease [Halobacteroides halobius]AGB40586.1 ABC-type Fe3+-siderophore transport system, permease component [Halobacteroides halobius DSM 5150]
MKINLKSISFIYKLIFSLFLLIGMFFLAMLFGAADITTTEVWQALTTTATGDNILIIREIRLPRGVAAIFVGAALAVSGAIMQGMTRNPLADPGLFGLTAGANAALAVAIGLFPSLNYLGIMISCFIGAALGSILVFGIASMNKKGFSPFRIVLAGSAVSAFLYAVADGASIYFKISKDVSMWTAGGIIGTSWSQLQIIIPFISIGLFISLLFSRHLTILSLNEEVAVGLGQNITQVKSILFIVIILLTGAAVSLVGNMVFIGLMVPHIVRSIVGTDYRFILPMSAIIGAVYMLFADTLGRTINAPYETPVVAIIAIMGLPFFLLIVSKRGRELL